ncbi:4-diphosphocytidyl-2-C-methyl-D-erythritol kinase [Sulfitobacter brevis]|uniref:4-diphosphocytidyl-2-C-methyl-D-erythritol kinase n=1 Tax=Sulfitobacter brevis TaxID=74348 RepID=A0A1I1TC99_9RHOB|nr:4-(cytidine 5'-diphospho)-2-C-methyl-D-erythritol kinase [Sulfitobacter brevis]SFD53943.1 4-diphosphocytidyl-2-C-methyl-D-erythritol kinase [Sulfitobacter brevis]
MKASSGFAPAKINLSLHVTGQRADGYHLLDSLVVFADVGDRLTFQPDSKLGIDVSGPFSQGVPDDSRNSVWQAAQAVGWSGRIAIEKNLPNGAGIGGGSADAAAFLRYFAQGDVAIDSEIALRLGADVPVCLSELPQRMRGIGENIAAVAGLPKLHMVLVNPRVALPTPAVFKALQVRENAPMETLPVEAGEEAVFNWLSEQRNDLETPAIAVQPVICSVLAALADARINRMSGSGATCFGLYATANEAAQAAARITHDFPEWWVIATTTVASRPS